ncbi:hypothetical protein Q4R93_15505, partial [Morganella morganii]
LPSAEKDFQRTGGLCRVCKSCLRRGGKEPRWRFCAMSFNLQHPVSVFLLHNFLLFRTLAPLFSHKAVSVVFIRFRDSFL